MAIICMGAPAYLYFGATSLVPLAERGSPVPAIVTAGITVVFLLWVAYALSAAGSLPALPFARSVLFVITALYLLRGLVLVPDVIRLVRGAGYPPRQAVFSAISLIIGVVHAVGLGAPRGLPPAAQRAV